MKRLFNLALIGFLILSPLFLYKEYMVSFARNLFFCVGSLTLFLITLNMKQERELQSPLLVVFSLFFLLRTLNINDAESAEWFNFWLSMAGFFYVLCGILLFRSVYCYATNVKQFFIAILIVCSLNLVFVSFEASGHELFWNQTSRFNPIYGLFEKPQQLSQYSAISIPILYSINPFLTIIPLVALFLSKEVSSILALFVGLMFFLFVRNKKRIIVFIVLCMTVLLLFNHEYVFMKWKTRPEMWKATIVKALKRPFLGWGYNSFDEVVLDNRKAFLGELSNPTAFSDYFHTALEFGFGVLIIIFLFFKNLFIRFYKLYGKSLTLVCLGASVFIGLVNAGGQCIIRYASVSGTYIILLALFCIRLREEEQCLKCGEIKTKKEKS